MSENKKEIEKLVEELNTEAQTIEFAYGATFDEKDEYEEVLNKAKETLDKLASVVNDKYEEIKNDEELKKKFDDTKEKAVNAFETAKKKAIEYYNSEEVQKTVKDVSKFAGEKYEEVKKVVTDEDSYNQAKLSVLKTTSEVCDKLQDLIKKGK